MKFEKRSQDFIGVETVSLILKMSAENDAILNYDEEDAESEQQENGKDAVLAAKRW